MTMPAAFALVFALLGAQAAQAADITVFPRQDVDMPVVAVSGTFEPGDYDKFRQETANLTGKVGVMLIGPGGSLAVGLNIGRFIRMKGWETRVTRQEPCASACALAWLGGVKRAMFKTSRVGFHAAYVERDGEPNTSSSGNAVVGAYLRDLGFGFRAIAFLTSIHPRSMGWLTLEDIEKYDLGVTILTPKSEAEPEVATPAPPPTPPPVAPARPRPPSMYDHPAKFTAVIRREIWSHDVNWETIKKGYAERVMYHDKEISRDEVIAAKKRFVEKWPSRTYKVRDDETLRAVCVPPSGDNVCDVYGVYDWRTVDYAQRKQARGVAAFQYRFRYVGRDSSLTVETLLETGKEMPGEVPRLPEITFSPPLFFQKRERAPSPDAAQLFKDVFKGK